MPIFFLSLIAATAIVLVILHYYSPLNENESLFVQVSRDPSVFIIGVIGLIVVPILTRFFALYIVGNTTNYIQTHVNSSACTFFNFESRCTDRDVALQYGYDKGLRFDDDEGKKLFEQIYLFEKEPVFTCALKDDLTFRKDCDLPDAQKNTIISRAKHVREIKASHVNLFDNVNKANRVLAALTDQKLLPTDAKQDPVLCQAQTLVDNKQLLQKYPNEYKNLKIALANYVTIVNQDNPWTVEPWVKVFAPEVKGYDTPHLPLVINTDKCKQ